MTVNDNEIINQMRMLGIDFINLSLMYPRDQLHTLWLTFNIVTYRFTNIIYV
jgi:hypothetical protein